MSDGQKYINWSLPVGTESIHWTDVYTETINKQKVIYQLNMNTNLYRAVVEDDDGDRTRKGWNGNLHNLIDEVHKLLKKK